MKLILSILGLLAFQMVCLLRSFNYVKLLSATRTRITYYNSITSRRTVHPDAKLQIPIMDI